MTPLGHAAASTLLSPRERLPVWPLILAGVAPDVDYLFVWAPQFNALHRVVTHNLLFVLIVAGLCAALWPRAQSRRAMIFAAAVLGGLAHLLVDACMDTNPTNGLGVAWLWPLSEAFFSPFNLMRLEPNPAGWGDPLVAARGVIRGLVFEVPLWLGAAWLWRKRLAPPDQDSEES